MKKLVGQLFFAFKNKQITDEKDDTAYSEPFKVLSTTGKNHVNNANLNNNDHEEGFELLNTNNEDLSEDYEPSEIESLRDSDEENFEEETLIFEETHDALLDLFSPGETETPIDYDWIVSTSHILQQKLLSNKTSTRAFLSGPTLTGINEPSGEECDFDLSCAVCKVNERNTILWPCRCFALCEDCRISLGLRGFSTCVCCRGKVHGYCKVHPISS